MDSDGSQREPLTRARLDPDERVIVEARPAPSLKVLWYLFTLGAYEAWRRASVVTVTDRRLVVSQGIVRRTFRSFPVPRIQDVNLTRVPGYGRLAVTTAGGSNPNRRSRLRHAKISLRTGAEGAIRTDWLPGHVASEIADTLNRLPAETHSPATP